VDSTALHALREVVERSRREGTLVVLSDVHAQPVVALVQSGIQAIVGEDNVQGNLDDALNRARAHLGLPPVQRPPFATPTVARETPATEGPPG
jgi:SulP family sulfate permease